MLAHSRAFVTQFGPGRRLLPVPIPTLGGWRPGAHRAIPSIVSLLLAWNTAMPESNATCTVTDLSEGRSSHEIVAEL